MIFLAGRGGVGVPAWVFLAFLAAFDVYFAYFVLSLCRDKPIVNGGPDYLRSLNMRLGRILLYTAVAHVIGLAYTLAEGGEMWVIAAWVMMPVGLGAWLTYAWKHYRDMLLKYNVGW